MKYICITGKARSGKDTVAQFLKEGLERRGKKVLVVHFADYLKFLCRTYLGWNGEKDEAGRHLLQTVGTELVRGQRPSFWVTALTDAVTLLNKREHWDFVIVADCRFPNEVISDRLVRVIRYGDNGLTEGAKQHVSENAMDDVEAWHTIFNTSTLDQLKRDCEFLADYLVMKGG